MDSPDFEQAVRLHRAGHLEAAEAIYRQFLADQGKRADCLHLLGVAAHQRSRFAEAMSLIRQAVIQDPQSSIYLANLGNALCALGRISDARICFQRALALCPDFAGALFNLGNVSRALGDVPTAETAYRRAAFLTPDWVEVWQNLGGLLHARACPKQAIECHRRAIALVPSHAESYSNLAAALMDLGLFDEALTPLQRAAALRPGWPEAIHNRCVALLELGRVDEAIRDLDAGLILHPRHSPMAMLAMFASLYVPQSSLADILTGTRRWVRAAGLDSVPSAVPPNLSVPHRPKIGFISGDFRAHAVAFLVQPALAELSRRGFHTICYSNCSQEDAVTNGVRRNTSEWRPISAISDEAVTAQILEDGVGILVDLSGYSRFNRLSVLAGRPAPVQATWIGYPATTGLKAIDYLIADRHQVPFGAESHYQEKIVRLPHSYICFEPPPDVPEPGYLPADRRGFVTFASFNVLKKLSPFVVRLWSRLLAQVPGSRLLIKASGLENAAARQRLCDLFLTEGGDSRRLTLIGRTSRVDHLALMADADIVLDSAPYSGGQTTLEALWMGLPVITLPGETFASRHSLGYLSTIGLPELVARSAEDYLAIARSLAGNHAHLRSLRQGLRSQMRASPLCDVSGFGASFEAALMRMWEMYQGGQPPGPINVA